MESDVSYFEVDAVFIECNEETNVQTDRQYGHADRNFCTHSYIYSQ